MIASFIAVVVSAQSAPKCEYSGYNVTGIPEARVGIQLVSTTRSIKWPNNSPGWVDTTMECKDACLAHPNCSAWVMFGNCNTGPNRTRTKHSCSMITDAAASWVDDGHYISGILPGKTVPNAQPYPHPLVPAPKGCVAPNNTFPWCDTSLSAEKRATLLTAQFTPSELAMLMNDEMNAVPRLGVPVYRYGHEALHGVELVCPVAGEWEKDGKCFTQFPTSSALVKSFNRTLWYLVGAAATDEARGAYNSGLMNAGVEGRYSGLHIRGPQLNPQRDPRWGRSMESPGESAYINGEYGAQVVLGGQGALPNGTYPNGPNHRKALREMKHFAAYSVEGGRNFASDTANISLRDLDEYYFPPLKACIDQADVGAIMCSYSSINGTASCGNEWLNIDVVRNHWNWSGVIETDCNAMNNPLLCGSDPAGLARCKSGENRAVQSLAATVDVECQGDFNLLPKAVNDSLATIARMQQAVARIFRGRFQFGEFDPESTLYSELNEDTIFSEQHQQLSLEGAEQSIVLLQNSAEQNSAAHLPLKRGLKVAVVGPNGDSSDVYFGEYSGPSCPEQPLNPGYFGCLPTGFDTIAAANTGGATTFASGCGTLDSDGNVLQPGLQQAHAFQQQACTHLVNMSYFNQTVRNADVIIIFVGQDVHVTEEEGKDRPIYGMAGLQPTLVKMVAELNKPVVVVLGSSSAVGMDFIKSRPDWSVVLPGLGGIYASRALARVLYGEVAPAGLLPYTIYPESWADCKSKTQCNNPFTDMSLTAGDGRTYKWYGYNNQTLEAAYTFGTGQYYTDFSITVVARPPQITSNAGAATPEDKGREGGVHARHARHVENGALLASYAVTYTNTGTVASRCRVILFARPVTIMDTAAPTPYPVKQILDFGGTPTVLAPGESYTETFSVYAGQLSMTNFAGKRSTYKGDYEVQFSIGNGTAATQPLSVASTTVLGQLPPPRTP